MLGILWNLYKTPGVTSRETWFHLAEDSVASAEAGSGCERHLALPVPRPRHDRARDTAEPITTPAMTQA